MLLLFVQKYDFIYKTPLLGRILTSNLIIHNNFFIGKHEKVGSDFVKQIVAKKWRASFMWTTRTPVTMKGEFGGKS